MQGKTLPYTVQTLQTSLSGFNPETRIFVRMPDGLLREIAFISVSKVFNGSTTEHAQGSLGMVLNLVKEVDDKPRCAALKLVSDDGVTE